MLIFADAGNRGLEVETECYGLTRTCSHGAERFGSFHLFPIRVDRVGGKEKLFFTAWPCDCGEQWKHEKFEGRREEKDLDS